MTQTDGKMKIIESNGKKLMLVEVPMEAYGIRLGYQPMTDRWFVDYHFQRTGNAFEDLARKPVLFEIGIVPDKLLGTITNGVIDFDETDYIYESSVVYSSDSSKIISVGWWDYMIGKYDDDFTSQDSFLSLLKKSGIEVKDKKFVVLKLK